MRFDEILRAHAFMRTERPPLLWEADTDDDVWRAGRVPSRGLLSNVGPRADDAGAAYAYTRDLGDGGAATVFLPRLLAR